MKQFYLILIVLVMYLNVSKAQAPQAFNYQAVVRTNSGNAVTNQNVSFRISILQGTTSGTNVYSEKHVVLTDAIGLASLQIGNGTVISGVFNLINWANSPYFIKVEVDPTGNENYVLSGTSQLLSVPYALYAGNTIGGGWMNNGENIYNSNTGNVGIGTNNPTSKLEVKGNGDTLFQVKDANGNPVFVVFPDGVKIYVDKDAKGNIGGFAVSGRSASKADESILYVTPDSTRLFVNQNVKGNIGGFAVSGRSASKLTVNEILKVTSEKTHVYVDENAKGNIGGFAVSGRSASKTDPTNYFNISPSTTPEIINPSQARVLWYPHKEAFLVGRVLIPYPDSVGLNSFTTGFQSNAYGDYSQAMGYQCVTRGDYSTAIGYYSSAEKDHSYAFGSGAKASNLNSYAIGFNAKVNGYLTQGGYAIGEESMSLGSFAYAIGLYSIAAGQNSYAIGAVTKAIGLGAYAIGEFAYSSNQESYSIGFKAKSTGMGAFAIGGNSIAHGNLSMALGTSNSYSADSTVAYGQNAFAIGSNSKTNADFAFAIGTGSRINGQPNIIADGEHAMVFGSFASSNNKFGSFVFGDWNSNYTESDILKATKNQQFVVRASGGYAFYTDKNLTPNKGFFISADTANFGFGVLFPDYKVTIKSNDYKTMRLIGPNSSTGYGARLSFGDNDKVYIEEDEDDKFKLYVVNRFSINGGNDLKVGIGEDNPDHTLTIYNKSTNRNTLQLKGTGDANGWATKLSFGTDNKTYFEHYAKEKFKLKIYNQFDILGENDFTINIGEVISNDHRFNIQAKSDNNVLKLIGAGVMYEGAKLSFGDAYGAYIQEDTDNHFKIFSYDGLVLNGNPSYRLGIRTETPSALVDIGGGVRTSVSLGGKNLLVAGDVEVDNNVYVDGYIKVGTNGTAIASFIKHVEDRDIAIIPANSAIKEYFTVPNAAVGAVVTVSPHNELTNGLVIAYARVSAANTVEVKFYNMTATPIDMSGMNYYFVITN